MAQINIDNKQFLFDFTFDDVSSHVSRAVVPRLVEDEKSLPAAASGIPAEPLLGEPAVINNEAALQPYGAWLSFDRRLSVADRKRYNSAALDIVKKPPNQITDEDRAAIRLYSGFGGTGEENERGVLYDYYTSPLSPL